MLNGGSYVGIPKSIRTQVNPVCEKFIQDHITEGKDFATETTLRSTVVFDQMKQAHAAGFDVVFLFVAVDSISRSIDRIALRADMGGHSGSEDTVRDIRLKSLANFPRVLHELGRSVDFLNVYDNSVEDAKPKLIASFQSRLVTFLAEEIPSWLDQALAQTPYSIENLRACCQQNIPIPSANTGSPSS